MASTRVADQLTEAHRLAQSRLSIETVAQLRRIWPTLNLANLDASDQWLDLATSIIRTQRLASAELGAQYLRFFRSLELGTPPSFTPELAAAINEEAVTTSLRVTGPVKVKQGLEAGQTLTQAAQTAFAAHSAAATRHTLDGGRDTIYNGREDRTLLGVARKTSSRPCAFCAMLASRGPVYFSIETASFRSHDVCHCQPEPVYRAGTWPAGSERFASLWAESTKGYSGQSAINAFRRAYSAS